MAVSPHLCWIIFGVPSNNGDHQLGFAQSTFFSSIYLPSGKHTKSIKKAIEIVDLPIYQLKFAIVLLTYQRAPHGTSIPLVEGSLSNSSFDVLFPLVG